MKTDKTLMRKSAEAVETGWDHFYYPHYLAGKRFDIYGESIFLKMLHLERKRTERCKRPFCLLLFDLERLGEQFARRQVSRKVAGFLHTLTRETDIKGWYKYDYVIGVILADTEAEGGERLAGKIRRKLSETLRPQDLACVSMTIHAYPEKAVDIEPDVPPDLTLYPDLAGPSPHPAAVAFKRAIDFAGAVAGLILFSPFFIFVPILIKLTSKGPVFFRQERMGQYEKKFTFLKFRTMYANNDPTIHKEFVKNLINGGDGNGGKAGNEGKTVYKIKRDPRVTPLGRFLRKSSIDELPQFINVLKGEMSLVGPRPPIPYEFESYDVWHRRRVMEIKPGITGLWQVKGRSSTSFDEMVRLDIKYMKEWSLWLDIKILLRTPWAVMFSKGAY